MWNSFFFRNRSSSRDNPLLTDHRVARHACKMLVRDVQLPMCLEGCASRPRVSAATRAPLDQPRPPWWLTPLTRRLHQSILHNVIQTLWDARGLLSQLIVGRLLLTSVVVGGGLTPTGDCRLVWCGPAAGWLRDVWKFILTGVCVCTTGQCGTHKDCRGFKLTDF